MSYILDALKKSEKERALGSVPSLDTVQPLRRRGRRVLWAALVVLCLGIAGAAGWWLARPPVASETAATPVPAGPPAGMAERVPEPAAAAAPPPGPAGDAAPPGGAAATVAAPPALAVNVISYSEDPERRFVLINLHRYREGETTREGVKILRIQPDRVVVAQGGRRWDLRP